MNTTNTEEVVKALQMLSGKTDGSYAPPPFMRSQNQMPAMKPVPQTIQDTLCNAEERQCGIAVLAGISYKSISGNFKDRDFLIRRVIHNKNEMYIDGLAMDIRAPRLVKVSEISQIRDIGTGRIYDNAYKFLQDKLGVEVSNEILPDQLPAFAKVIERMHNEIAVLMYVVALDGIREKVERSAVANYVRDQTADLTYTDEELQDYLISVAPDSESAGMAFQRIMAKDRSAIESFVKALINVIMANGAADEKERVFLAKVIDLLETQGFELNLSL